MSRVVAVRPMTMAVGLIFGRRGMRKGNTAQRRSRRWRRARRYSLAMAAKYDPSRYTCNWIERNGVPEPLHDLLEWGRWMQTADRQVALSLVGPVEVSTVFLGVDYNFRVFGPPLLYETMVFLRTAGDGRWSDRWTERYATREQAIAGHEAITERAKKGEFDPPGAYAVEDEEEPCRSRS